ncbi:helix-turn-helix transcriptional regulator [Streptomyces sp. NPDC020766]|uniref:helix-turn-helix transcriptional regulator n=1 Tax=Streptomyces sp. NPDC020766 TaxID=3155011 RepID=UPI0033D09FAB
MDLITAFLAHHTDTEDSVPPKSRHHALMAGIHSFFERNLADPQLSPATVAASHHISVRYLHKLFQPQGIAVSAWIRLRRLEHCRRDLTDAQLSDKPIGFLSARWGFVHASEFTRVFRREYGIPPSAYRQEALHSQQCTDRQLRLGEQAI